MKNFQTRKKSWRRVLSSKLALFLLFVIIVFFAWSVLQLGLKLKETEKNKNLALEKVSVLKEKKENLSEEIEKLNTEKGIEENIREKFGLVRPGEKVIVIVEEETQTEIKKVEEEGFWRFIKKWFSKEGV